MSLSFPTGMSASHPRNHQQAHVRPVNLILCVLKDKNLVLAAILFIAVLTLIDQNSPQTRQQHPFLRNPQEHPTLKTPDIWIELIHPHGFPMIETKKNLHFMTPVVHLHGDSHHVVTCTGMRLFPPGRWKASYCETEYLNRSISKTAKFYNCSFDGRYRYAADKGEVILPNKTFVFDNWLYYLDSTITHVKTETQQVEDGITLYRGHHRSTGINGAHYAHLVTVMAGKQGDVYTDCTTYHNPVFSGESPKADYIFSYVHNTTIALKNSSIYLTEASSFEYEDIGFRPNLMSEASKFFSKKTSGCYKNGTYVA